MERSGDHFHHSFSGPSTNTATPAPGLPRELPRAFARKQTDFIIELLGRAPKLRFVGPEIKQLASGLYEIRFGIVNDGYLPTTTVMARRAQAIAPTIVRLSVPVEQRHAKRILQIGN